MPLPLRKVEPVYVSRGNLPPKFNVLNDLEAEANGTLSNVILQLSSLSHHAGEIFTDLVRVATDITTRSANLQGRLDRIAVKVAQMDGVHDEYSMQDCLNTKPFQSSNAYDQQVVSRSTMPAGMLKIHMSCDRPPPLEKLNVYRDDGKDGLKFYTDPSYFFDLWKTEMLKDTEKAVRKQLSEELQEPHKPKPKGDRKPNKRIRELQKTREKQAHNAIQRGEHIMQPNSLRSPTEGHSKPIEMGDSVIYPPEAMIRRTSRPESMEIKQVSFDDKIDEIDHEENSQPVSRLEQLYSANQYNAFTKEIINKNDQNQNEIDKLIHHHYYQQNQKSLTSQSSGNTYNRIESQNTQRIRQSGQSISNVDFNTSRRKSSSSSNSSLRLTRPSKPPPAPPNFSVYGVPTSMSTRSQATTPTDRAARALNIRGDRETLPPPPPPPSALLDHSVMSDQANETSHHNGNNFPEPLDPVLPPPSSFLMMDDDDDELPIPPPPPAALLDHQYDHGMDLTSSPPPPLDMTGNHQNSYQQSQAPPPPPPALLDHMSPVSPTEAQQNGKVITKEKRVIPPPVPDTRSELLKAIRGGINLKKVDEKKISGSKEDKATALCDVASILARRVAVEMSDSDDSSDYDSEGWDETSA